jgi:hypothetical protein
LTPNNDFELFTSGINLCMTYLTSVTKKKKSSSTEKTTADYYHPTHHQCFDKEDATAQDLSSSSLSMSFDKCRRKHKDCWEKKSLKFQEKCKNDDFSYLDINGELSLLKHLDNSSYSSRHRKEESRTSSPAFVSPASSPLTNNHTMFNNNKILSFQSNDYVDDQDTILHSNDFEPVVRKNSFSLFSGCE